MSELRLVIFDVDGTLVDSQADIMASMNAAFSGEGLPTPDRAAVLSIVGLSLPAAMARLAPDRSEVALLRMVKTYKETYAALRRIGGPEASPLYPGARAVLDRFAGEDWTLMAIATGKSRRGLNALIESLGMERFFVTTQVADDHPSKPHPSMILACLSETGVAPERALMIGDTSYDIEMARAAGIRSIGVSWGYHPVSELAADRVVDEFAALPGAVDELLGELA